MGTNEVSPFAQVVGIGCAADEFLGHHRRSAAIPRRFRVCHGIRQPIAASARLSSPDNSSGATNDIRTFAVPTTNPYYPTDAPNNLRVSYDLSFEVPVRQPAYEISYRYAVGFNLDLPFAWSGNLYYSHSYDSNAFYLHNVNDNAVSVALGWNVGGVTKPASVPYMNLFCDPRAFQCNSPATLAYIVGARDG